MITRTDLNHTDNPGADLCYAKEVAFPPACGNSVRINVLAERAVSFGVVVNSDKLVED
ncbi:MAG: hypothetical protein PF508_19290 [Spirochaeta sp.]|nr:hypothetical protein [Spirochaeta sp.]